MIHLYIKRCSHCELLYFGRTTSDPYTYPGSGVYWRRHLAKHKAHDVTIQVRSFKSQERCTKAALRFSERYNIVEARNPDGKKVWANHIAENGADGGSVAGTLSKKSRAKMSANHAGRRIFNDGYRQYKLREGDPLIKELRLKPGRTTEACANISASLTGRIRSEEHKTNISAAKKGRSPNLTEEQRARRRFQSGGENNGMYGRTHTKEARALMAEATRRQHRLHGNPMDRPEARAKLSAVKTGTLCFNDGVRNYYFQPDDPRAKKMTRGLLRK